MAEPFDLLTTLQRHWPGEWTQHPEPGSFSRCLLPGLLEAVVWGSGRGAGHAGLVYGSGTHQRLSFRHDVTTLEDWPTAIRAVRAHAHKMAAAFVKATGWEPPEREQLVEHALEVSQALDPTTARPEHAEALAMAQQARSLLERAVRPVATREEAQAMSLHDLGATVMSLPTALRRGARTVRPEVIVMVDDD